jgi:hypothetical protein
MISFHLPACSRRPSLMRRPPAARAFRSDEHDVVGNSDIHDSASLINLRLIDLHRASDFIVAELPFSFEDARKMTCRSNVDFPRCRL